MPWKLQAPRPPRQPNYHVRGTYLGIYVDRSTGTRDRRAAARILKTWQEQAERGEFEKPEAEGPLTFAQAATAYMKAGGERSFLVPILRSIGTRPVTNLNQIAIDTLAQQLYPNGTSATRNRQVYTPVSAVLKHVGVEIKIRRPKGAQGGKRQFWLMPEPTFRMLEQAHTLAPEFGILCTLLNYTGLRLSEALGLRCNNVDLSRAYAYIPITKTDEPRAVHLPPVVIASLAGHPRGIDRPQERLFRYHKGGRLMDLLKMSAEAAGVELPYRTAFHVFRHNYATWMKLYGGLDVVGLVRTGAWADIELGRTLRPQ